MWRYYTLQNKLSQICHIFLDKTSSASAAERMRGGHVTHKHCLYAAIVAFDSAYVVYIEIPETVSGILLSSTYSCLRGG